MLSIQNAVECCWLTGETDSFKPPHVQFNRRFPFIVAVCVLEGAYDVTSLPDGRVFSAQPGEAVIVPEQLAHNIAMHAPGRLTWAHFCCRTGGRDVLSGLTSPQVVTGAAAECLLRSCERLNASANEASGMQAQLQQHSHISAMAACLLDALNPPVFIPSEPVRAAMEFIERRMAEPLSVAGIAEAVGLSASSLEKRFHAEVRTSPLQYLRECRIRRAVGLLMEGLRVSETAEAVGYGDPYYFSRVFRQSVGMSPAQYQKRYQRKT